MQLCVPPNGRKKSYLQLATHGGGFDSRYWDSEVEPEGHSYVEAALDAGYSILTYDRIACGQSSKPNGYTDVQAPAELEILRVISAMARSGEISNYSSRSSSSYNLSVAFDKIIHVGHSYGSFITFALTANYPNVSDAAVLTGFIPNKEFNQARQTALDLQYAPEADPELFADSSSGYLIPSSRSAIQTGFFSSRVNETTGTGGFDPKFLEYAYSLRQPTTAPELGSASVLLAKAVSSPQQFTGPVQFLLAEFDFLVCLGDCRNTYNTTQVHEMYPKAKGVDIHIQPGTGHGLPFHNNAQLGFKATFDWLEENGL
jgi:pimeloyl-ACP methyl ester carboxylesterase